jgi:hypothetical protein
MDLSVLSPLNTVRSSSVSLPHFSLTLPAAAELLPIALYAIPIHVGLLTSRHCSNEAPVWETEASRSMRSLDRLRASKMMGSLSNGAQCGSKPMVPAL